jgi:hypothetical protein
MAERDSEDVEPAPEIGTRRWCPDRQHTPL